MGVKYDDKQVVWGSYQTSPKQFPNPEGVKTFPGYGADASDLERGFVPVVARELPIYDKANHVEKWTGYRVSDEDGNGGEDLKDDVDFRMKDRETKGLFVRPRIPTER